ncbi:aspartyl protease family protein [Christiangramia echinicola]|uniref:aspartyl protease family protein n=1 Tax=Christiangramia echinicola TaxID=279359 RepID=UPI0003FE8BD3|nr:aspartyl protease family protein [Christiangramia echinicola]
MISNSKIPARVIVFLVSVIFTNVFSQNDFEIDNDKGYFKQKFELVNDLVILPVELNGRKLSFLLDTGVNSTILFSFTSEDSIEVNNPSVIYIKGLGSGKPLRALKSKKNKLRVGEAISFDLDVYLIEGGVFSISNRLGIPINGILGYDFFKDFVVEFNYRAEWMKVYHPDEFKYKKCRRCVELPLQFYKQKPYIQAEVSINDNESEIVDLLVDSGSGDALWLFKDPGKGLYVPEKSFKDFLGFGITGSVYGDRSRIDGLSLKDYSFKDITVSFPDSLSLVAVNSFEERDGSIGAQVLKRFHSVFDYQRRILRLKPNGNFRDPFEYNMSGIVIRHNGYRMVKDEAIVKSQFNIENENKDGVLAYSSGKKVNIIFSLEPSYEIAEVRPDSPADISGLQVGDEVIEINGRPVYRYNLKKINEILSSKEGRRIKIEVVRKGRPIEIEFRLERIL